MTPLVRTAFLLVALLGSSLIGATPDPGLIASSVAADAGDDRMLIAWTTRQGDSSRVRAALVDLRGVEVLAELEMPFRGAAQDHPAVSFGGTTFLLAWVDGTEIRGVRISAEGLMLDAEPILIADDTLPDPPALDWNGEAWVAGWSRLTSRIHLRRISAQGLVIDAAPVTLPPVPRSAAQRKPQIDCNGSECLVVAYAPIPDGCRILCPGPADALALWVIDRALAPRDPIDPSSIEFGYIPSFDVAWSRDAWLLVWGTQFARRIGRDGLPLEATTDQRSWPPYGHERAHATVIGDGAGWTIVRDSAGPWPLLAYDTEWSRDGTWTPHVVSLAVPEGSSRPRLVRGAESWLVWTVTGEAGSEIALAPLDHLVGPALTFTASVERTGDEVHVTWEAPPREPFEFRIETLTWSPVYGPHWGYRAHVAATDRSAAFRLYPNTTAIRVAAVYEEGSVVYSTPVSLAKRRAVGR